MRIVLIGPRGSGKTSTAEYLAKKFTFAVACTDRLIEKKAGMKISELVKKNGWEDFRDMEQDIIESIKDEEAIIDSGGGAIEREQNRNALKTGAFVVYLKGSPAVLSSRIEHDNNRPSLTANSDPAKEMEQVLKKREPLYLEMADQVIDTDNLRPEAVAKIIATEYSSKLTENAKEKIWLPTFIIG